MNFLETECIVFETVKHKSLISSRFHAQDAATSSTERKPRMDMKRTSNWMKMKTKCAPSLTMTQSSSAAEEN